MADFENFLRLPDWKRKGIKRLVASAVRWWVGTTRCQLGKALRITRRWWDKGLSGRAHSRESRPLPGDALSHSSHTHSRESPHPTKGPGSHSSGYIYYEGTPRVGDLQARYHSLSHLQARYSSHSLFFPPSPSDTQSFTQLATGCSNPPSYFEG